MTIKAIVIEEHRAALLLTVDCRIMIIAQLYWLEHCSPPLYSQFTFYTCHVFNRFYLNTFKYDVRNIHYVWGCNLAGIN